MTTPHFHSHDELHHEHHHGHDHDHPHHPPAGMVTIELSPHTPHHSHPSMQIQSSLPNFSLGPVERKSPFLPASSSTIVTTPFLPSSSAPSLNYHPSTSPKAKTLSQVFSALFRQFTTDPKLFPVFICSCLIGFTAFVCLVYGFWAASLALAANGYHLLFNFFGFWISLASVSAVRQTPNSLFSYGYDRIEILGGFTNGSFVVFVTLLLVKETLARAVDPHHAHPNFSSFFLMFLGVCSIALHVVSFAFFRRYSQMKLVRETRYVRDEFKASSPLVHTILDCYSAIVVIVSAWCSSWESGWMWVDSLGALSVGVLLFSDAYPLCVQTGKVLLQTRPVSIQDSLDKAIREASTIDGVLDCRNEHFWTQAPGVFVGTLSVRIRGDANEQKVLAGVTNAFSHLMISHLTVQVEKEDWGAFPPRVTSS